MSNLKLSETPEPVRAARLKYIDSRAEQLLRLMEDSELRVLRYLTLTNAGGAVATLSFLGASESVRALAAPKVSLGLFLLGLILVGILIAFAWHHIEGLSKSWRINGSKYMGDEIIWGALLEDDDNRAGQARGLYIVLGYGSFACFIVGVIVGVIAIFL